MAKFKLVDLEKTFSDSAREAAAASRKAKGGVGRISSAKRALAHREKNGGDQGFDHHVEGRVHKMQRWDDKSGDHTVIHAEKAGPGKLKLTHFHDEYSGDHAIKEHFGRDVKVGDTITHKEFLKAGRHMHGQLRSTGNY